MPLLEIKNLSVVFHTYLGKVHAVRDVSFSIKKGETVALVGESGCGKSVTAQAIMGLIPEPPGKIIGGEIYFEDHELLKKNKNKLHSIRGKAIGMVFQDPMTSLNPTMKIGSQIAEGLIKHQRLSRKQAKGQVIELLHLVGIPEPEVRMEQYPHQFSGGMRQRAMIAIALACKPRLLIADEPTTALDVTVQAQILELMKKIQKEIGSSILLITHDLGIVAGMCDRVVVMYGGQIVEMGSVEELFYNPLHPYTQALLRAVPRLDMEKDKELVAIEGTPPNLLTPPSGCPFWARCGSAMQICKSICPTLETINETQQVACWLGKKK